MLGYAVFAVLAILTLDGKLRAFIVFLMFAFALKSVLAALRDRQT